MAYRTSSQPGPNPPNPSTTWENLVADSEARQCHNAHIHAWSVHYKGRPARSQCAHARWGPPNSSLTHSLAHSLSTLSTTPVTPQAEVQPVPVGTVCAQNCSQHPSTAKSLERWNRTPHREPISLRPSSTETTPLDRLAAADAERRRLGVGRGRGASGTRS